MSFFSNFLSGMTQLEEEYARLKELKEQFETSDKLGLAECNKCGYCCHVRSCIPTPEELVKIAGFLKLTTTELINEYYCIDYMNYGDPYYVKPAGINQLDLTGSLIPDDRTFNEGKCVFLEDNNLCKIHEVKPKSARVQECWAESDYEIKETINSWDGDQLSKLYEGDIE